MSEFSPYLGMTPYALDYPAPGAPQLAQVIQQHLLDAGQPCALDAQRPRDHGVWVPLRLLYPLADIPVLQLSLPSAGGPALQWQIGQTLAGLRAQGILLIGSGSITHNLQELDWQDAEATVAPWAEQFRDWMVQRLEDYDRPALLDYRQQAPHAVRNHPSEEHLLPLFFACAAGQRFSSCHRGFSHAALGMDIYRFD